MTDLPFWLLLITWIWLAYEHRYQLFDIKRAKK